MELQVQLEGNKKVNAQFKGHLIHTDQPVKVGGEDSAPAPLDLFFASIGTCAGFYVQSFCTSRNIPTDNIKIVQKMHYNAETKLTDQIEVSIELPDDFPMKYKDAVKNAADLCSVKKHLHTPPEIRVVTNKD